MIEFLSGSVAGAILLVVIAIQWANYTLTKHPGKLEIVISKAADRLAGIPPELRMALRKIASDLRAAVKANKPGPQE